MLLRRQRCQRHSFTLKHHEQLIFCRRIDQREAHYVSGVLRLEQPDEDAAAGRTDHHERRLLACGIEECSQVANDANRCFDIRPWVAPAEAGTVVRADARRRRDFGLHQGEVDGERAGTRLDQDGWRAAASAMQVQPAAADVDQAPGRRARLDLLCNEENHDREERGAVHYEHDITPRRNCAYLTVVSRSTESGTAKSAVRMPDTCIWP